MAGCTRETVTRAIQMLRKKKYVAVDSLTIRIDTDAMQRYLTSELTVPDTPDGTARSSVIGG
jgi:hypothetical protein